MEFTTLNTITEDLLKIIRGSIIADTEPISKRQLEAWVHQYRAELIRQDIDKGYYPNPDYIQEIRNLELEDSLWVDFYKTVLEIPKTIDLRYGSGLRWVGDMYMNEITMVPNSRATWQQFKRYTSDDRIGFLEEGHIHLSKRPYPIHEITVKGIFENPMEVLRFANPTIPEPLADMNVPYPIPVNKIPTLKEMILTKELKVEASAPSDISDDNTHNPKQVQ